VCEKKKKKKNYRQVICNNILASNSTATFKNEFKVAAKEHLSATNLKSLLTKLFLLQSNSMHCFIACVSSFKSPLLTLMYAGGGKIIDIDSILIKKVKGCYSVAIAGFLTRLQWANSS
jgi:hypothetical protein